MSLSPDAGADVLRRLIASGEINCLSAPEFVNGGLSFDESFNCETCVGVYVMRQSAVRDTDLHALVDGLGAVAFTQAGAAHPADPAALLWLIQHVRDLWTMRMAAQE